MSRRLQLWRLVPVLLLLCLQPFRVSVRAADAPGISPSEPLTADALRLLMPETNIPFQGEITRGQFCHCLNVRLTEDDLTLLPRTVSAPSDVDVSVPFCREVEYIVQGGVMGCDEDGLFRPRETMTVGSALLGLHRLELLSRERRNAQPATSLPVHAASDPAVFDSACMLGHSNALGLYRSEKNGMDYFVMNGITAGRYVDYNYLLLSNGKKGSYLTGLAQGSYDYAYVMLGTNDVHRGPSELSVYQSSIREITENVRQLQPGVSLCFLSVTPMGFCEKDTPEFHRQEIIRLYNEALKSLSRECGADYIDLFTPLCDRDGYNRPELARADGIHYKQSGYDLITELLLTHYPED